MTVKVRDTSYFAFTIVTDNRILLIVAGVVVKKLGIKFFHFHSSTPSAVKLVSADLELVIDEITLANPTVVQTTVAHGMTTGDIVEIRGSDSTPTIDGPRVATVTDATHFTVPVNVTVAGIVAEALSKAVDVVGIMETEGASGDGKAAVQMGNGGHLVAMCPTGQGLYLVTTLSTTVGGGAVVVDEIADDRDYATVAFD